MTRRRTFELRFELVETDARDPGVVMLRVWGYADLGELWLYALDTGELISTAALPGLDGCRLPRQPPEDWPALAAIVARACPEMRVAADSRGYH